MKLFETVPLGNDSDPVIDATRFLVLLHSPATEPYPLPVDPEAIAEQVGLVTIEAELPASDSGHLQWDDLGPSIMVNQNQTQLQRRFTQAVELGRFVDIVQSGKREEFRNNSYHNDVYAINFAKELLMPRIALWQYLNSSHNTKQLAKTFGVDPATLQRRIEDFS